CCWSCWWWSVWPTAHPATSGSDRTQVPSSTPSARRTAGRAHAPDGRVLPWRSDAPCPCSGSVTAADTDARGALLGHDLDRQGPHTQRGARATARYGRVHAYDEVGTAATLRGECGVEAAPGNEMLDVTCQRR